MLKSIFRDCAAVHLCQKGKLLDADSEMFLVVCLGFFLTLLLWYEQTFFPSLQYSHVPLLFPSFKEMSISVNYISRGIFICGGISQTLSLI